MSHYQYIYGYHTLIHWLTEQPEQINLIQIKRNVAGKRIEKIIHLAQLKKVPVEVGCSITLKACDKEAVHQGIVARVNLPKSHSPSKHTAPLASLASDDLFSFLSERQKQRSALMLLILDRVQDPHNLGACLRTACFMGVDAVIVPKDQAVGLTPTVRKVASGADLHTPFFQVTNLARAMVKLKAMGIWLYGASEESEISLYDLSLKNTSIAWVMGGEARGLRRLTQEQCDKIVCIPAAGQFTTLNISVAAGICLAETQRQRR